MGKRICILLLVVGCFSQCEKKQYEPLNEKYSFHLPELPYGYGSLEPVLWSQIIYIHHKKEHTKLLAGLNYLTQNYGEYRDLTVVELLEEYGLEDPMVAKYAGGHYNHCLLWWSLIGASCAKSQPEGDLLAAIEREWGTFEDFKQEFTTYSASLFGTGWVWLCSNRAGELEIKGKQDEYSPLADGDCYPFLGIDLWEHAFYLYYIYNKEDYAKLWWEIVDWDLIEYWYENYSAKGKAVPV